jgi:poly-beta-1,6-N-acetyl-D-glucosamine synthase
VGRLDPSARARSSQIAGKAETRSPGRHSRGAPGPDVRQVFYAPVQHDTITLPIPRLTYETATDAMGDTQVADLETSWWASTLVRDVPRTQVRIAVLIPAHNEQDYIAATIEGVQAQTRQADRIIVVPNNCNDDDNTAKIAAGYYGVEVMELHGITGRKAGALNAALNAVLPDLRDDDLVVCMDADTMIHSDLLQNAERHFQEDPRLGAVSSNHLIKRFGTLIELLQAMEYERDRRFIGRRKGRYGCMTGMAAMYRVATLRDVKRVHGEVYDPDNWTEDWKLTMALKHLRWGMVRPQDCLATTVPVSTVKGLFFQRERWARGYIQTLRQFGLTRWTVIPWAKQAGLIWSVAARVVLLYLLWTVRGHLLAWWCLPVFIILMADSVNTAHRAGWRAALLALAFPVEMLYAWLITVAIASGYWKELTKTGKNDAWKMVRGT